MQVWTGVPIHEETEEIAPGCLHSLNQLAKCVAPFTSPVKGDETS